MAKRYLVIGVVCCLCIGMVGIVVADSESLRAANAIDTPEESPGPGTTVNHIGVFEQGEQIEATVTGPDKPYNITLYDSSNSPINNQTNVSETVEFNSSNLDPGSYLIAGNDTAFDYVSPVVISGYDIDVETTENGTTDELTIMSTVTETALEGVPHTVEAVIWNDETNNRIELTTDEEFSSSAEYTGTASLEQFDGKSYQVYVVATSDNEVQGENEILAIEEAADINQDDSDDTNGETSASTGSDDTNGETGESDDDDSSVIEPNTSTNGESTTADDESQTDDGPVDETADDTPVSMVIPVVALLLAAFGIARVKN